MTDQPQHTPRLANSAALSDELDGLRCRSCGEATIVPILALGDQPLANALREQSELANEEAVYPLSVVLCTSCSLVQLTVSVPPEELFADYPYFSSVIGGLVRHAGELSTRLIAERDLGPESLVMEVASNDGYLLQHYHAAGIDVLGVEPAANIATVARSRGIPTVCAFFGEEVARELAADGVKPDLIHANNVLAHVPQLNGFVAGLEILLGERGRAVIETPYVKDLIDGVEFDTIYHEHLCYYSLTALDSLFRRHGLVVEDVERIPIHGGSLRVSVAPEAVAAPTPAVAALLDEEAGWGVNSPDPYLEFAARVDQIEKRLRGMLGELKSGGARIAAYGAAAKGSTLLNTYGIGTETLDFVADLSEHKQGRHMPGSGLPIVAPGELLSRRPDYVLLLAWNFANEILEQQREYRESGGRFIVPVPEPRIV